MEVSGAVPEKQRIIIERFIVMEVTLNYRGATYVKFVKLD
tara:strand:+ start:20169 stop:20288 length:120 start_codon:yes stop_codon:yes gene_type:complete